MFCDKCPHQAEINAALAPCQTCEHASFRGTGTPDNASGSACADCPHLKEIEKAMRPCGTCDAGKMHVQVSLDAGEAATLALQRAVPNDHCPSAGVTALPPEVEDALRKMLFVLFDFTPIELLLIQHVCHGHGVATFRRPLAELRERLNRNYDLSDGSDNFKATAHAWKKKIMAKFPAIREMFDGERNRDRGRGHGIRG